MAFIFAGGLMRRIPKLASIDADYRDAGLLLNSPRQSVIISLKYVRRVDDGKMERHYDFWILGDTGYRKL